MRGDVAKFDLAASEDIVDGWYFAATHQFRTPLAVLLRHGEVCRATEPPEIVSEPWQGMWMPRLRKNWTAFLASATTVSDFGPIPASEKGYWHLLVNFRRIVELPVESSERIRLLRGLMLGESPEGFSYAEAMRKSIRGDIDALIEGYLPRVLTLIPTLRSKPRMALIEAGICTITDLRAISDDELRQIRGIGMKTLRAIRAFVEHPPPGISTDDERL